MRVKLQAPGQAGDAEIVAVVEEELAAGGDDFRFGAWRARCSLATVLEAGCLTLFALPDALPLRFSFCVALYFFSAAFANFRACFATFLACLSALRACLNLALADLACLRAVSTCFSASTARACKRRDSSDVCLFVLVRFIAFIQHWYRSNLHAAKPLGPSRSFGDAGIRHPPNASAGLLHF